VVQEDQKLERKLDKPLYYDGKIKSWGYIKIGDIARGFRVDRYSVTAVPLLIGDNTIHKNCVLIKNMGPGTLWVYPNNTITQANGYPMGVNECLSIGMQDRSPEVPGWALIQVWAISNATTSIAVLSESI
jgi:hypothetical protein